MEVVRLIKAGKEKEATDMLNEVLGSSGGESIDEYEDEDGNTVLHHASDAGMTKLVLQILDDYPHIIDNTNKNDQTAVHKAVQKSRVETFVALACNEADLNIKDKNEECPLDIALKNKDIEMITLLCDFGAEPIDLEDILMIGLSSLSEADQRLMMPILQQRERVEAMEYDLIVHQLEHVIPDDLPQFSSDIGIIVKESKTNDDYFLFVSKNSPDLHNVQSMLKPDETVFSDVYEIKSWGPKPESIVIEVTMEGRPRINERLQLLPIQGKVSGSFSGVVEEDLTSDGRTMEITTASLRVNLKSPVTFAVVIKECVEEYNVGSGAQCIDLKMDPGSKISFPAGTFSSSCKMTLNVLESKTWNSEEHPDQDVLFTNLLEIIMSDGSQPNHPVTITLPVHSSVPRDADLVVLATKKELTDDDDDEWEMSEIKERGDNSVAFDMHHFSVCVLTSKLLAKQAKKTATKASKQLRDVQCFVMMRKHAQTRLTMVVELAFKDNGEKRRKYWKRMGFVTQQVVYKDAKLKERMTYIIKCTGNLNINNIVDEKHGTITLMPNSGDKNYRVFELKNNGNSTIEGEVCIGMKEKQSNGLNQSQQNPSLWSIVRATFKSRKTEVNQDLKVEVYKEIVTLPLDQTVAAAERHSEIKLDPTDIQCTIPVLRWKSLLRLSQNLTKDECKTLARELKVPDSKLAAKGGNIQELWFRKWRPSRPSKNLVKRLTTALEAIGKITEARKVNEAFKVELEYFQ